MIPPPAPRRPSPRARRLIFAYQGSQNVLRIIGAAFVLMGLPMSIFFTWGLPADLLVAVSSRVVPGRVLPPEAEAPPGTGDQGPADVRFEYDYEDRTYTGSASTVMWTPPPDLPPVVPIEVSTLVPSIARLQDTTFNPFGLFTLFTLVFPVVGAGLLVSAVRSNRREIRAFVHGQPVTARIVSAGPDTTTTVNGRHPFKVDWEFRVADGVYGGTLSHMDASELREIAEAKQVTVLYDPADPAANTVWIE